MIREDKCPRLASPWDPSARILVPDGGSAESPASTPAAHCPRFLRVLSRSLPLFLMLAWIYSVALTVKAVVREKETRLCCTIRAMGLSGAVLWLGWFLSCLGPFLLSTALLMLVLKVGALRPSRLQDGCTCTREGNRQGAPRGVARPWANPCAPSSCLCLPAARGHPPLQPRGGALPVLGGFQGGHGGPELLSERLLLPSQPGSRLRGPRLLRALSALRAVRGLAGPTARGRPCGRGESRVGWGAGVQGTLSCPCFPPTYLPAPTRRAFCCPWPSASAARTWHCWRSRARARSGTTWALGLQPMSSAWPRPRVFCCSTLDSTASPLGTWRLCAQVGRKRCTGAREAGLRGGAQDGAGLRGSGSRR